MVDLTAISRLTWFPGVSEAPGSATLGVRGWLGSGSLTPASSLSNSLNYLIESELAGALAFDANSFALKAVETIDAITINAEFPRASAWPAIKIYYAAFFSALFLMRLSGRGSVFLYRADASNLAALWNLHNAPHDLRRGAYAIFCDCSTKGVQLVRSPEGLGVHEAAWREFHAFLLFLEASTGSLVASDQEKDDVRSALSAIRSVLQRDNNNNGNWLSSRRNQVNYQNDIRLWFPYRDSERTSDLIGYLRNCDGMLDSRKLSRVNDDVAFFLVSSFIFRWALKVMDDVGRRSSGGKTLFAQGIRHYISRTSMKNLSPIAG